MLWEAAGTRASLQRAAEPIAAARGGAGAAAEHRPAPARRSWPGLRGEQRRVRSSGGRLPGSIAGASRCPRSISPASGTKSRKHASKVRLYYMLHPIDGGCPAKKLRSENGSDGDSVDKNKCCTLCNMSFTSAVVAESHYQGKIHAKRLKLLLGEQPALKGTGTTLNPLKQPHTDSAPVVPSPPQRRDSDRYCQLCAAWFNNPMMAQQHYDGKKHKKNAARADLLEQLGKTLDLGELRGLKRSYTCNICSVTLNSIEQYHAHLKGSKHQTNLKNQ
ncbi:zinc finger matrin-type protein 4 isoform X3 [Pezoporus wallicus]|uniref:zinc finger matrin-type protein 4 isoform X3 n=1 Tax=Pezoporus wallicus TaxID=35540 RepID=UPI002550A55F|nr:zinc finger matrin-type protein 4 isoform X3 [Pezoporus wallicus]XP_061328487.1 zinc finger matrin-type protein 4 isoform X3 [Pezoporus flaviventris]